jgi:hypothetical protein
MLGVERYHRCSPAFPGRELFRRTYNVAVQNIEVAIADLLVTSSIVKSAVMLHTPRVRFARAVYIPEPSSTLARYQRNDSPIPCTASVKEVKRLMHWYPRSLNINFQHWSTCWFYYFYSFKHPTLPRLKTTESDTQVVEHPSNPRDLSSSPAQVLLLYSHPSYSTRFSRPLRRAFSFENVVLPCHFHLSTSV